MSAKEIKEQIELTNKEICDLRSKKHDLLGQLKEATQVEFEVQRGVKPGDLIVTYRNTKYFYGGFGIDACGCIVVICHPVKNDGTASKVTRHLCVSDFEHEN